jgi:hypothetical protein
LILVSDASRRECDLKPTIVEMPMAPRVFPFSVREQQASPAMRVRHEMWHFVRAVWKNPSFGAAGKGFLTQLGWALPDNRAPMDGDGRLILDNAAGEDFLFMHRDMIRMTDMSLAAENEPPITRWSSVPGPMDLETPVPPAWEYNDPTQTTEENEGMTRFLQFIKSDQYFDDTMRTRAAFFENQSNLGRLSLGALGNLVEMTIHNAMHMRWSEEPNPYRTQSIFRILAGQDTYDSTWDAVSYDYLGDTFSSHVNPHFWYLHGWVDSLIDRWAIANEMQPQDIVWTGTWLGGPDLLDVLGLGAGPVAMAMPQPPEGLTASIARTALVSLNQLAEAADLRLNLFDRVMAVEKP